MDTYVISVNHKSSTGEWLASVNKNGRFYEPATAYVDDPEEAVDTAIATIKLYRKNGHRAELSNAQATLKQVSKYRPDFLIEEARAAFSRLRPASTWSDDPATKILHYGP